MTRYIAAKEFGELVIFGSLLLLWRPRRWPQFFALDMPQEIEEEEMQAVRGIMQKAVVRDSVAWSNNTSFYSESEPFVVVHPVESGEYNIDKDKHINGEMADLNVLS